MELVIKYKPTIEKQLLTPLAYKIVQWIAPCEFLIVLSLPWLWFKLIGFKCRRFKLSFRCDFGSNNLFYFVSFYYLGFR